MGLLWTLIIGAIAGWLAGTLVKGRGFGLIVDIIVGIVGAFIGGWVFGLLGLTAWGLLGQLCMATIGAVIPWSAEAIRAPVAQPLRAVKHSTPAKQKPQPKFQSGHFPTPTIPRLALYKAHHQCYLFSRNRQYARARRQGHGSSTLHSFCLGTIPSQNVA
jgi:uncharacterized membrane protein YeaQ/YmgE (transglycosylase-associated protein family)